ncbi:MAG: urease accessory protein UreE [Granulosicoccus sp.]|nr:urease accessory protein UreE [Granulosicoccus sp.]
MLHINTKCQQPATPDDSVTLIFELRSKSRQRVRLDSGQEAAISLVRGSQLFPGDLLISDCGKVVEVKAGNEKLSIVQSDDQLLLARASYHLGNRHIALQINHNELRYLHDHVLDEMVEGLGLAVQVELLPFMPESGAYGEHAHVPGHSH